MKKLKKFNEILIVALSIAVLLIALYSCNLSSRLGKIEKVAKKYGEIE